MTWKPVESVMLVWRRAVHVSVMMHARSTSASFDPTCGWLMISPPACLSSVRPRSSSNGNRMAGAHAEAEAKEDAEEDAEEDADADADIQAEEETAEETDADAWIQAYGCLWVPTAADGHPPMGIVDACEHCMEQDAEAVWMAVGLVGDVSGLVGGEDSRYRRAHPVHGRWLTSAKDRIYR
jgi:hypothetical protein